MISQDQLIKIYQDSSANLLLIDVRSPYEYNDRHIPGSVNIPIDELENRINEIDKTRKIITVCEHGVRSGICEKFLKEKGYNAESLENGMSVWQGQVE